MISEGMIFEDDGKLALRSFVVCPSFPVLRAPEFSPGLNPPPFPPGPAASPQPGSVGEDEAVEPVAFEN